jgi:hypothetical protein
MKFCVISLLAGTGLCACHTSDPPTADPLLRKRIGEPVDLLRRCKSPFLGNTSLLIRVTRTTLLDCAGKVYIA